MSCLSCLQDISNYKSADCHPGTGPSPRIEKWSGGGSHRVPKAREGESMRRGLFPLSLGGFGALPEKIFEYLTLLCAFLLGFLCVSDQILVVLVTKIFLVA